MRSRGSSFSKTHILPLFSKRWVSVVYGGPGVKESGREGVRERREGGNDREMEREGGRMQGGRSPRRGGRKGKSPRREGGREKEEWRGSGEEWRSREE